MMKLPLKERLRKTREQAILETARELMSERGYSAVTMDDLACAVGISKATLYQHFRTKEEIIIQVVLDVIESVKEFTTAIDSSLPAINRLEQIARRMLMMRFERSSHIISHSSLTLIPVVLSDPRYQKAYGNLVNHVSSVIAEAIEQGDADRRINARVAAQILVSLVRDLEYDVLIASEQLDFDTVSETLVRVLMSGLRLKAAHNP